MQTTLIASTLKDTVSTRPGVRMSFRLTAQETNNTLSVIDVRLTPGSEPPRHVHQREDETNIIHDGTITYFIGDDIINAKKGDIVFMPRGVPHHFVVTSPTAHCTLIVTPGGIEDFFNEIGLPFVQNVIPAVIKPSPEEIKKLITSAAKFGISFV